jgi:hypothetical protein
MEKYGRAMILAMIYNDLKGEIGGLRRNWRLKE